MKSIPLVIRLGRLLAAVTLMLGPTGPVFAGFTSAPASPDKNTAAVQAVGEKGVKSAQIAPALSAGLKIPMYFEANHGQTDASVKFFTRAAGYNLYLTGTEAVMVMPKAAAAKSRESDVLRMKLKGANAKALVQGMDTLPGRTSYFLGSDSSKWQVGVNQYAKVKLAQVYPGIDMVYRFDKGNVEYDFVVAPGANPWRIMLGFEGAKGLRLDAKGNLVLRTDVGEMTYKAPQLYQTLGSKRVSVKGRFVLASNNNVRFEVGNYVKSKELVIDPQLAYSTFIGGLVDDHVNAIAVDEAGQAYVTGWTNSAKTDFPSSIGTGSLVDPAADNGGSDVFVGKISADGTTLMWLAWLGGNSTDEAKGIALDKSDPSKPKVFITGFTASAGTPFPYTATGNFQPCAPNTGTLAFVTKLEQSGTNPTLVYSTCWGGVSGTDTNVGNAIAVDVAGAAYVTGTTKSTSFPLLGGASSPYNVTGGWSEAGFVMKITAVPVVAYSMFLGTTDTYTRSNAIAVDSIGQAWVAGVTASPTLPEVTHHFSNTIVGPTDAFVAEVNTAGTGLLYATYINGNSDDEATAIALNKNGVAPDYNVFVAGWTKSPTDFPSTAYLNLPVSVRPTVYQKTLVGADDPFILRLNPFATAVGDPTNPLEMVYATHLGATAADRANAIALDNIDDAYIAGWTESSDWVISTVPPDPLVTSAGAINVTPGKVMGNTCAGQTAFVAAIGPTGQYQPFFTYLGATNPGHAATGIAIDSAHNIYVGGYAHDADFPLMTGSVRTVLNNTGTETWYDGFVTKITPVLSFGLPVPPACTITGLNPSSGFAVGGTTVAVTGSGFGGIFGVKFDNTNPQNMYDLNASSTAFKVVAPAHAVGSVPFTIYTTAGSCTATYNYVSASACGGKDFFFPSPATGNAAHFEYCMARPGTVKIRVYNVIGDIVAKIEDVKAAGAQLSSLNTGRLAPGVYLYRLEKNYDNGTSTTSSVQKFVVKH